MRRSALNFIRPALPTILAVLLAATLVALPAEAKKKRSKPASAPPAAQDEKTGAGEPQPPAYRPQILRLAEILGALAYLEDLCGKRLDGDWRASMQALVEAEARSNFDKELLAGTFNRSFRGYEMSYRTCTPNARAVISRYLDEGRNITHAILDRYGSS